MILLNIFLRFVCPFLFSFTLALYVEWDWAWRITLLCMSFYLAGGMQRLLDEHFK